MGQLRCDSRTYTREVGYERTDEARRCEQLTPGGTTCAFRVGEWSVEPALDEISRNGEVIRLEPRTMKLLVRLAESPGQVISSQQLMNSVWNGVIVGSASVYQAISQLRKVLGDTDPAPTYIATIPRRGYRLVAPVERREGIDARDAPTTGQKSTAPARPASRMRQHWGIAALVVMITVGIAIVLAVRTPQQTQIETTPVPPAALDSRTIAVLPIVAATHDEPTQTLAPIVTDLLRTRLAALHNLIVIADGSTQHALQTKRDIGAVAQELHARYLLRGEVASIDDRIRLDVSLVDAGTSVPVWSSKFDRPVAQIADVQDEIARQTAESLQITLDPAAFASTNAPVNLAAYHLYLRGRRLMSTMRAADAKQASVIFSRVTTLDPSFARGYLAYGEALLLAADQGAWSMTAELAAEAGKAFDRALELNPALGEAWAQRGRLTADPVAAEELYRRGIQLAPSRDESYIHYSSFLFSQRRRGEALALIDRARRIDPLSASLCWYKAIMILATHGDVAGMEQLLREALMIKPDLPPALRSLSESRAMWSGEFAEAIRLLERWIAIDPGSDIGDEVIELYLELDDPSAAMAVLRNTPGPDYVERNLFILPDHKNYSQITIAQYLGDTKRAAELARDGLRESLTAALSSPEVSNDQRTYAVHQELVGRYWHDANALRDEAIATG
jgi:DNA-binding winged helix-turn-helix (wHTH) protein/TolB-like protein